MIGFARPVLAGIVLLSSFAFAQTAASTQAASTQAASTQAPSTPTPPSVPAQDSVPKVQVFAGYSLLHADNGGVTGTYLDLNLRQPNNTFGVRTNFNGWNAEGQYNFSRLVGVVADFAGYYGSPITPYGSNSAAGLPSQSSYSLMAGPVFTYRRNKRVVPYVHALFGFTRTSLSSSTITGIANPISSSATTYNDFAIALGGGIDYKLNRRFALRLGQLDWYHTSLNLNSYYGSAYGVGLFQGLSTNQRNLRFSTGIVVNF
jgi:opacity protein-like surface antigen